jgi:hypothetical protein
MDIGRVRVVPRRDIPHEILVHLGRHQTKTIVFGSLGGMIVLTGITSLFKGHISGAFEAFQLCWCWLQL